jgi:hypothetical protein
MKYIVLASLSALLLGLSACHKEDAEPSQPNYADWYALRAPETRAIQAVYGDLDETLVISTRFKIYQTKDQGKTWLTSDYSAHYGVEGFIMRNDTLLALTATLGGVGTSNASYATNASYYSVDKGATWLPYRNWTREVNFDPKVLLNSATSPAGIEYSIDVRRTPVSPGSTSNYIETIGVKSAIGTQLTLPKDHDITSVYFDAKSRLYVTASAALCGRRENFAFCDEQNGVLYVSKKPQP